MKKRLRVARLLLVLEATIGMWPKGGAAQKIDATVSEPSGNSWLDASQQTEIDQIFVRPQNAPGYAIAVIKDGAFALAKGYGLANLDDGVPITRNPPFI